MKKNTLFKRSILLLFLPFLFNATRSQTASQVTVPDKMEWWREARFGMFIHWGVYAVPAGVHQGEDVDGLGEWIMHDVNIPRDTYARYARQFNPRHYNPDAWVRMAKEAGMKYMVVTSKHHDGFALFDSKASDWNVVKATPYGKDLLKPLVEACRRQGMKLGFYYSQANDWYNPGGAAARGHWDKSQEGSMDDYIQNVAVPQLKEILTNYGDVVELWWDVPTDMNEERARKLYELLQLQPGIIINDRLGGGFKGDITTPEQFIPATGIPGRDWETCMTMNDTWGFKTKDNNWKSSTTLIRNLVDIASKGGNYLLNVGPDADGEFPAPIVERLRSIGDWTRINGEAIYGTTASPFTILPWGRATKRGDGNNTTLYLHVFNWPANGYLLVPGLAATVTNASLLAGNHKLTTTASKEGLRITVPLQAPDKIATVIKLKISGPLTIHPYTISAQSNGTVQLQAAEATMVPGKDSSSAIVEGNDEQRNVGYWTSNQSTICWNVSFTKAGVYKVHAKAATPAPVTKFYVQIGNTALPATVNSTGNYNRYQEMMLGTIRIEKPGTYTVAIKPDAQEWGAMNLRSLTLECIN